MAIHVKNMKELNKALQPVLKGMVGEMADRVEQTLNYFLQEYYDSYDPVYYRRLYDFLHSEGGVCVSEAGSVINSSIDCPSAFCQSASPG